MPMCPKRSLLSVLSSKKAISVLLCIFISTRYLLIIKYINTDDHEIVQEIYDLIDNVDSITITNAMSQSTTSDTTTTTTAFAPITTTTTVAESSPLPSCPSFQNSDRWLESERMSNSDVMLTHELVQSLIFNVSPLDTIDGSKDVLEQSMCLETSNFLNWKNDVLASEHQTGLKEDEQIKNLAVRLIFIALHEHQHGPARAEAIARYSHNCEKKDISSGRSNISSTIQSELETSNIGKFDFECPDTKYIVTIVPELGLGAALKLGVSEALFKGLTSNRVVLYMNSVPNSVIKQEPFNRPWRLASCPRKDIQCVFMPPSPCVITQDDLSKAPVLSREALDKFSKTGRFDEEYENEKVLIMLPFTKRIKPPPIGLNEVVVNKITSLYSKKVKEEVHDGDASAPQETYSSSLSSKAWDLNDDLLEKVKKFILQSNHWLIHDVIQMYLLRPNQASRKKLNEAFHKAIPENFNPKTAIGVPIRGSDKCSRESECMEFSDYAQMIQEFATKRIQMRQNSTESTTESTIPPYDTVILSSESKEIIEARKAYTPKNESFPFDFIINDEDVGQGSGHPKQWKAYTIDDILLSTMIALKLQLLPDALVINSCSNHHRMIQSFAEKGCGQVNYIEPLHQNDNPRFRMQCHNLKKLKYNRQN